MDDQAVLSSPSKRKRARSTRSSSSTHSTTAFGMRVDPNDSAIARADGKSERATRCANRQDTKDSNATALAEQSYRAALSASSSSNVTLTKATDSDRLEVEPKKETSPPLGDVTRGNKHKSAAQGKARKKRSRETPHKRLHGTTPNQIRDELGQDEENSKASKVEESEDQIRINKLLAKLSKAEAAEAQLRSRLLLHEATVVEQRQTLAEIQAQCSCTICLELAWRPHVLTPCGHVFCAQCLVSWFRQPLPNEARYPRDDLLEEDRAREETRRTLRRTKICPHCREAVRGLPAEVWLVKGLVERVHQSMQPGQTTEDSVRSELRAEQQQKENHGKTLTTGKDLWKDIFRDPSKVRLAPLYDETDDVLRCAACTFEVVDGGCTNPDCNAEYDNPDSSSDEGSYDPRLRPFAYLGNGNIVLDADGDDEDSEFDDGSDGESDGEDDGFIDDSDELGVVAGNADERDFGQRHYEEETEDGDDDEVLEVNSSGEVVGGGLHRGRRLIVALPDSGEEGSEQDNDHSRPPRSARMEDREQDRARSPPMMHFSDAERSANNSDDSMQSQVNASQRLDTETDTEQEFDVSDSD